MVQASGISPLFVVRSSRLSWERVRVTWQYGKEPRERFSVEAARIEAEWQAVSTVPPLRMQWELEVDAAGLVWVVPDENYPGFASTLADSLGSLSPAGEAPCL